MNYPVPNLGMDREILNSIENVPIAEGLVGHKWTSMGTEENKKKLHNVAKDTLYDFEPKLSHEIVISVDNLKDAEKKLDHEYTLAWKTKGKTAQKWLIIEILWAYVHDELRKNVKWQINLVVN